MQKWNISLISALNLNDSILKVKYCCKHIELIIWSSFFKPIMYKLLKNIMKKKPETSMHNDKYYYADNNFYIIVIIFSVK